jgi:hypothetical protein
LIAFAKTIESVEAVSAEMKRPSATILKAAKRLGVSLKSDAKLGMKK